MADLTAPSAEYVQAVCDRLRRYHANDHTLDAYTTGTTIDTIERLAALNSRLLRALSLLLDTTGLDVCEYDEHETMCLMHELEPADDGLCPLHGIAALAEQYRAGL